MVQGKSSSHPRILYPVTSLGGGFLIALVEGATKGYETEGRDEAQHDGDGLLELDGAGNSRSSEDNGGQEAQLKAIRLAIADTGAAEAI